jgi:HD-GYP domain-containing protein (c-di-GMP phosphodiesterase class II)
MALDPNLAEQQRILHELNVRGGGLAHREAVVERLLGGAFVLLAAALAWSGSLAGASWPAIAGAVLAFVAATHVEFDIGGGFAVPTQLAFVPLAFVVPASHLPLVVGAAWLLRRAPDLLRGRGSAARLWVAVGNGWFAVGPTLVLLLAGVRDASAAGPALLCAALAAQFLVDLVVSEIRETPFRRLDLLSQARELRVVIAIDAALAPIGYLVGVHAVEAAWSTFALLPLLAVLGVFARERRERVRSLAELSSAYRGTAYVLGDVIEADDGYTGEHSRGVVPLVMETGERLGLPAERLRNLEFGALLHDVGKIAIPKEIINKPGRLDPDEWRIVKTHTTEGQLLLDRVGGFMSEVGRIVRSHHERWDGGGYPDGLAGDAIPLESRIIAACDTWSAMTTDRVYRRALDPEVAVAELTSCAGSQLDPAVVAVVLGIVAPQAAPDRGPQAVAA